MTPTPVSFLALRKLPQQDTATDVRSGFTIGEVVAINSEVSVGDVAYILESLQNVPLKLHPDTSKAVKACDSKPDSSRCAKATQRKEKTCSAILDF